MIPTFTPDEPARLDAWQGWLENVEQAGGAVVALVDALPSEANVEALVAAGARGWFVSMDAR